LSSNRRGPEVLAGTTRARETVPSPAREGSPRSAAVAERVQAILDSKELSLYRVSQESAELYGRSSPYFLPHNLYYDLRTGSFRPSIHQISALSRISGYRLTDWLRIFCFDLEDITRLQILLPSKRTIVLDTSLIDPNEWVPWLDNRPLGVSMPSIAPLAKLLREAPARQVGFLQDASVRRFLYAKVGREDAFAFPDLAPGSIVRVNPDIEDSVALPENSSISDRIFLVEHSKGFCCCRVRVLGNGVIVPFDNGLSYAQVELHCPQEARLWGVVDLEFRPLLRREELEVPKDLARNWKPQPLLAHEDFGRLLKRTRRRMNLSVREAAAQSRTIAEVLKDDRYTTSPSSLSDYELGKAPPRDFHKIITLCSIYGLQFESVMKRMGVDVADAGTESMPERYLSRAEPPVTAKSADADIVPAGFLGKLLEECQEIPFFLRHSLGYFSGSAHVSLDDFFWVGGDNDPLHPYLAKGLLVMVNRRRKTAFHFVSKPVWQQPIYLVLRRDGMYLAACCGVEHDKLVVRPYARDFHSTAEYRNRQDAEVVGQIVAIARKLP
jgi:transcriptional regulator with XRE-family HTH domain